MGDIESDRIVEPEQGESGRRGGEPSLRRGEGPSEQTSFAGGRPRHLTTVYDNSRHDKSTHHQGDNHVTTNIYNGGQTSVDMRFNQARDLLVAHVSHGALHNSAQRGPDAPKCFRETRIAVQGEIRSWIEHGHQDTNPKKILHLSGPAGSGKTAIAGSIADDCYKEGLLAASFFFSSFAGSLDRCSTTSFVATLAYQLIRHASIRGLRDEVLSALDGDPLILKMDLNAQVDALILDPLRKVVGRSNPQFWPQLVLVDGLDECGGDKGGGGEVGDAQRSREDAHREVLSVLVHAASDPSFPFRIIVASRPEQAISRFFLSLPEGSVKEVFLNDKYDPTADIELFIRAMLRTIGRDRRLQEDWYTDALPSDWLEHETRDVPLYLAEQASGQFIYAATVIRYVQDATTGNTPIEQLRCILSSRRQSGPNPFSALDALYFMILQTSPTPLLSATWIVSIQQIPSDEAWFIKALLESSPGETEIRLGNLASIVGVPSVEEDEFTFYHKSLFDFLEQPERSGELYVGEQGVDSFLNDRHYQVLKNRGPQVLMCNVHLLNRFIVNFCNDYFWIYSPTFLYDASDVDWWCSHADFEHNSGWSIPFAFFRVHNECRWYRCSSNCKVWRKGMMRHFKAKGWRVPTWAELLRDRFKKIRHPDNNYFLRPRLSIEDISTDGGEAGSRAEDPSSSLNSEPEENSRV